MPSSSRQPRCGQVTRTERRLAALAGAGAVLAALAGCTQPAPPLTPVRPAAATPQPQAVAGTILRVIKGHETGELRITEETGPDAGTPPYPACLLSHAAGQRVINFDLNWAGINFGTHRPAPAVTVTITGPGGTPLTAEIPHNNPPSTCQTVRAFALTAQAKGWQLVYALTVRQQADTRLAYLHVTVDGQPAQISMSPVCNQGNCFQDNPYPPLPWTPGTPWSPTLIIQNK